MSRSISLSIEITPTLKSVGSQIRLGLEKDLKELSGVGENVGGNLGKKLGNALTRNLGASLSHIPPKVRKVGAKAGGLLTEAFQEIGAKSGRRLGDELARGVTTAVDAGVQAVPKVVDSVVTRAGAILSGDLSSIGDLSGRNLGNALADQAVTVIGRGLDALPSLVSRAGVKAGEVLSTKFKAGGAMAGRAGGELLAEKANSWIERGLSKMPPAVQEFGSQLGETLGTTLPDAGAQIGEALATSLVDSATPLISQGFSAANDVLQGLASGFRAGVKEADQLASSVGSTGRASKRASGGMRLLTGAQRALNGAMKANPIGLVITALGLLATGLVYAYNKSKTFRNIVNGAWNGIKSTAQGVVSFFQEKVWPVLVDGATQTANFLTPIWNKIKDRFELVWGAISKIFDNVVRQFNGYVKIIRGIFTGDWAMVWDGAKDVVSAAWSNIVTIVTTFAQIMWDNIKTFFIDLPTMIGGWISGAADHIKTNLPLWWNAFKTWFVETVPLLLAELHGWGEAIAQWLITDLPALVLEKIAGLWNAISTWFQEKIPLIIERLVEWGEAIGQWLMNDLPPLVIEKLATLKREVLTWFEELPEKIHAAIDKAARVQEWFADWGPKIIAGLVIAFAATALAIPALIAAVGAVILIALATIVAGMVSYAVREFRRVAIEAMQSLRNGIAERVPSVVAFVQGIPGRIRTALSGARDLLYGVGQQIVSGLIRGATSMASNLNQSLRSMASNALTAAKRALGINSPSRVFRDEVGRHIVTGIALGLERNTGRVDDAMSGLTSRMTAPPLLRPPMSLEVRRHASAVAGAASRAPIQIVNHYPQAEPTSTTVNRSLQYAAAIGVV